MRATSCRFSSVSFILAPAQTMALLVRTILPNTAFPKPGVAGSIPAEGTKKLSCSG
jgi:hypothetical protein